MNSISSRQTSNAWRRPWGGEEKLDVVIDDGLHSKEAIIANWCVVKPHLAPRCVYFIEDFAGLIDVCGEEFAGFDTNAIGLMTVVSRGLVLH